MHYLSKQDLASAYFPDNSKETASKRFAHEIHSNKPLLAALQAAGLLAALQAAGLLDALRPTGYRPAQKPPPPPPPANSKSSSPSSANPKVISPKH